MRRVIGALVLLAVIALQAGPGVTAQAEPMVLDKETGHYKDMSYKALSDEGLSWEEKTRIFGGDTATYGPLPAEQRKAKQKELKELLAKIDMKLVNKCEAEVRAWLDKRAARPLKNANWRKDWTLFTRVATTHLSLGSAVLFRAYELFGDEKYLKAGLKRADVYLRDQTKRGNWRQNKVNDGRICRIQDKNQDLPFFTILYAYKLTGDKKYLESAKRCADLLLTIQRPDSGGWGDQWCFDGARSGSSGVIHGTSHNDSATTSPFAMMVMMYHITKEEKYVANLRKLGKHIEKTNLGKGDVVGWAEAYRDGGAPQRVRQYEIEICYSHSLSRSIGNLLTWLYLMDGNEKHMELMKKAYNTFERGRRKDLEPKNWAAWKTIIEAGEKRKGPSAWYRPGWSHGLLPDGSNTGSILGFRMYAIYPVTPEQRKKWGHFLHGNSGGDLYEWAEKAKAGQTPPAKFAGAGGGNTMSQVRRALLEHKRGGYKGLLKYYTGPTKYTPDQYLQARVDAAKRALDPRNVRLASMHEKGIKSVPNCGSLGGAKVRWYGPKKTKWGRAYEDRINDPVRTGWYQWQLVYDTMIAQGKVSADAAARGGRGLEHWTANCTHLDSWDALGQYSMHVFEVENHFDMPIKGKKK